jgi:ZIP family zinc transporter
MMYVSFVEIFQKSQAGFEDAGLSFGVANLCATLCFFGGIMFNKALNEIAHRVGGHTELDHHDHVVDFDKLKENLDKMNKEEQPTENGVSKGGAAGSLEKPVIGANIEVGAAVSEVQLSDMVGKQQQGTDGDEEPPPDPKLIQMGMQTALAIGIHNFPEGLATFVATLDDPLVGAGLAVAIAIHNIPEGLCVSVPIYYATRDRHEAFKWAFISGISEPIGAALGWLVLYRIMDDMAYGVVFGLVAGMMVNICVKELIPTALKYDPNDEVVSAAFIFGMAAMATSLVLFVIV